LPKNQLILLSKVSKHSKQTWRASGAGKRALGGCPLVGGDNRAGDLLTHIDGRISNDRGGKQLYPESAVL